MFTARIEVPKRGFTLEKDRHGCRWLQPVLPPGQEVLYPPDDYRVYDPFEEPALFLRFAEVPLEEASILAFVNRWGDVTESGHRDLVEEFGAEQARMAQAIGHWEESRKAVPKGLSGNKAREAALRKEDAIESLDGALLDRTREGLQVNIVRTSGMIEVGARVESLRVALWLLLALAVAEDRQFNRCQGCGLPLAVGKGTARGDARTDKQYCGTSCRVTAYRHRRAHARELRAHGYAPAAIAKKLGVDLQSVRRWTAKGE